MPEQTILEQILDQQRALHKQNEEIIRLLKRILGDLLPEAISMTYDTSATRFTDESQR